MNFGCCTENNSKGDEVIICTKCKQSNHFDCMTAAGLSRDALKSSSWKCPACLSSAPKNPKTDSTPARNVAVTRGSKRPAPGSPSEDDAAATAAVTRNDVRVIVQELLKQELSSAVREITASMLNIISSQLEPLKQELKEVQESMNYMSTRFDDIETEQAAAKRTVKELQAENSKLQNTILDLSHRVNQMEQQSRSNNVEIQCVPENKKENLYSLVSSIAKVVNSDITESSILHCTRIAKLNTETTRPRSIVVQLASPRARDHLLAAVINFNKSNPNNKLNSAHLGFAGIKSPIFVVEHLSQANKKLHAAARHTAKDKSYKHVWVRNGKIFVRKTDDSDIVYVKSADSLNKIV